MKTIKEKKEARYTRIIQQLQGLMQKSQNKIARMATVAAVIHHKMVGFFWTGFYLLQDGILIVGPYQGPVACLELEKNRGVCWAVLTGEKTILVQDVLKFPDHIACDPRSRSEIAVPLRNNSREIIGVFDVDSDKLAHFDETDAYYLEKIADLIYSL